MSRFRGIMVVSGLVLVVAACQAQSAAPATGTPSQPSGSAGSSQPGGSGVYYLAPQS